jgi:hypothetical protein
MQFEAILRGVNFRPASAKEVVTNLEEGQKLNLEREPGNEYDENAIKVIEPESGEFIGYVAKEIAAELAPHMDAGIAFSCMVQGFMRVGMPILEIVQTGTDDTFDDVDAED